MTEPFSPGERAFGHVCYLVQRIGPRPAGSDAERQAHDYVARQLTGWGYHVQRLPASFAPLPGFFFPNVFGSLVLVLGSWGVQSFPWLAIWLPLVFAALPQVTRWWIRQRPRTAQTENVVAYTGTPSENTPRLILCAHVDSAQASTFGPIFWRWLQSRTMDIVQRVAIVIAGLAALKLLGFALPEALFLGVGVVGSIAGGWLAYLKIWVQLFQRERYSPGANDNASGVGVVLALAEHFAVHPPGHFCMGFLFTGAEETGMHGAESFAAIHRQAPERTMVLGFDMVGAGNVLRFITKDGILFPLRTDTRLNALVSKANPEALEMRYTLKSGDFASFLRQGIPATTLQTSGSKQAEIAYHTIHDTLELIEITSLEMTIQTVIKLVELTEPRA